MDKDELKKEAEEYGIDLCAYCRECEGEKPCQHKLDAMHGYQDGLKEREKRIVDLEKENAELKEQQFSLRNERNTFLAQNEQYEKDLIDFNENLTNAKKIIKEFMKYEINEYDGSLEIHFEELKKQAEQFLSEVEK